MVTLLGQSQDPSGSWHQTHFAHSYLHTAPQQEGATLVTRRHSQASPREFGILSNCDQWRSQRN